MRLVKGDHDPAPPLVQTTEVKQTTTQTVPAQPKKKGR